MKTLYKIKGKEYGFFICPPMTIGNNKYYALVRNLSDLKDIQSPAFNSAKKAEVWLRNQLLILKSK